jgi:DNA-binding SARP family transcriptional activator
LRAHTTGAFAVYSRSSGKEITPRGRKARALLAYLISDAGTKMPKDRMAGLLWGGRRDAQARSSLRQALMELRVSCNGSRQLIHCDRDHIWIATDCFIEGPVNPEAECKDAFEDLDNISPEFDEWLAGERGRRTANRIAMLSAEAEQLLAKGLAADSSVLVDQIQALDPCNEESLRLGMKAAFQRGHPAEVARRYKAVAEALNVELGVEPSTESRALRERLLPQPTVVDCSSGPSFANLYETVERTLNMGAWECDLITGHVCWTPGTFNLFGVPVGSTIRREEILEQYESRSREHLEAVRAEAIRHGTGFSIAVDIATRGGFKKRLRINAAVESRDGVPVRVFGTKQLVS